MWIRFPFVFGLTFLTECILASVSWGREKRPEYQGATHNLISWAMGMGSETFSLTKAHRRVTDLPESGGNYYMEFCLPG